MSASESHRSWFPRLNTPPLFTQANHDAVRGLTAAYGLV
jgi:hypothetical protein